MRFNKRISIVNDWNAQQYLQFETERTRPAADLLSHVVGAAQRVADLGCGPGNSTELLIARFPDATVIGVDNSDDMLAKARKRLPTVTFAKADLVHWRATTPMDVVFANAVMQWIPSHIRVMQDIVEQLAPRGRLAVQMPDNLDEPTHSLMRETAKNVSFSSKLASAASSRESIGAFEDYYAALSPRCARVDFWRTTYAHILESPRAIVEWVKGTGLRPFLDPLTPEEQTEYLARYEEAIAKAYPPLADGRVLLRFPRVFIVAAKGA
jgi:trans-aconitate 2-methyltransferase